MVLWGLGLREDEGQLGMTEKSMRGWVKDCTKGERLKGHHEMTQNGGAPEVPKWLERGGGGWEDAGVCR